MKRVVMRRALLESMHFRACGRRYNSQTADACAAAKEVDIFPQLPTFDYTPPPYTGPTAAEILAKRKEFLSPSMFYFYKKPVNIVHGKMQYLFDENGRRYLDAFGGIATVCCGHCHPDVNPYNTPLFYTSIMQFTDFAEALASKLPGDLKVVFFTNSGTEANELAMMMARLYTGSHDIISLRNAYHGNAAGTMGATAQSNWKFNVVQSGVHHAMNPDPYRGLFGSNGEEYAKDVHDLIQFGTSGHVAAFVSEAIQMRFSLDLLELEAIFGDLKTQGVVPDIVTMAKGIGNGIPLGAVVTTPKIAEVLTRRSYFNTFGGNPVCTAAGLAVLRVIERENLQENAHGRGLMLGVELVTDRQLKTPAKVEILQVMDQMKDMGVLVGKGGFYGNVFRITPPLCFSREDADFLVDAMDYAISKL
ncbi:UNVERIFIED_CONTAM: Alanine--glyoxylate aminotransferase 23, mitochondrial [Sesamum angustifolium]|uniref:Alanine--glyoxylate aminotransferase 23, mitochondrial n=1 Tax=Sesamum angustifolium TaxID=2727405 RepID=A0AAW2N4H4_9LAMI